MVEISVNCNDCGVTLKIEDIQQHFLLSSHSNLTTFIQPLIDSGAAGGGGGGGGVADGMDVDACGIVASGGNSTNEAVVNRIVNPNVDQMPMVPAIPKNELRKSTKEDKKKKLLELRERALKKKKEEEERQAHRKKKEEEWQAQRRRNVEEWQAYKKEELEARARRQQEQEEEARRQKEIEERQALEQAEAIKHVLLQALHEAQKEKRREEGIQLQRLEEAVKVLKPRIVGELMRECLWSLKKTHKGEDARVMTAFQTLLTYAGNVMKNPDEEKYRKIRLTNQTFQDRVGGLKGATEFLELCGFNKSEDGEWLYMARDNIDAGVLNTAGIELQFQIGNPELFN